jgi:hypothetical protein
LVTWHWDGDDGPVLNASQGHGLFAGKQLAVLGVIFKLRLFAGDGLVFSDGGFEIGGFLFVSKRLFGCFHVLLVVKVTRGEFKVFVGHDRGVLKRIKQKLLYEIKENYIIR